MPEVHLYGPPSLVLDDGTVHTLSAREAGLVAWLALEGPATRARLAGLLWPRGSAGQARTNLRQTLARLRRAVGEIVRDQAGVLCLSPDVIVAGNSQHRVLLDGAEPTGTDEFADWVAARRDEQQRDAQRHALDRGQRALSAGDLDEALAAADAVLRLAPENEQAWRLRMETLARRGDRASALQAWDECRRALRAAFGVSPSPQTEALGRRLLDAAVITQAAAQTLPPQLVRPGLMVGRAHEIEAALQCLLLRHAAIVIGPAGIGKSRLLHEAMQRIGGGVFVGARPGDTSRPGAMLARLASELIEHFGSFLDAQDARNLRRLLPPQAGVPEPPEIASALERQRVLASVASALRRSAAHGLRAVALDDLHFADETSVGALRDVAGEWAAHGTPAWGWLLGARPGELGTAAEGLVGDLLRGGRAATIEVTPLAPEDIGRILSELPLPGGIQHEELARSLHASLGGNPSYMLESLKLMWLKGWQSWRRDATVPVPPSVRESVRQRLAALSPQALALVQIAAVAQRDFSGTLAAAVLGCGTFELAAWLAELRQQQLFDRQRFAHDVIAEEVQRTLPHALAQSLHARIAAALMPLRGAEAGVAWHLALSGDVVAAAPWHRRAAESLRRSWQMAAAAQAFEASAGGYKLAGDSSAATAAWREAARCWIVISRAPEALAALDESEAFARTARERFLVRSTRATALFNAGSDAGAASTAQSLLETLREDALSVSADEAGQALLSAALAGPYLREPRVLIDTCHALRDRAQGDEKFERRIDYCEAMTWGWLAQPLKALALLQAAWDSAQARRDWGELINIGNQLVRCAEMRGDLGAALVACDQTQWAIERAGAGKGFEADLASHRAMLHAAARDAAGAQRSLERWLALRGSVEAAAGYELLRYALTLWWCGQRSDAVAPLERARESVAGKATPLAAHAHWTALRVLQPQPAEAKAILDEAAACCHCPDGLLAMRQRVMQSRYARGAPLADAELSELAARGLMGLHHAARAIEHDECRDPWCG